MSEVTVTGKIEFIGEVKKISDKLSKREIVVTTAEQYPQSIPMELVNAKCSLVDNAKVGDDITAHINLRGRKWVNPQGEVKYFGSNECWKVVIVAGSTSAETPANNDKDKSGLPF